MGTGRRRQQDLSQVFAAGMPATLNSTQLRRHDGGKDWDDLCWIPGSTGDYMPQVGRRHMRTRLKTESRGRHIWQQSPTFPAITRLRFRLAPRTHEGFGFSCSIETVATKEGCRSQNQYINDKHLLIQKALSE